jgi:hypothetical protein
LSRNTLNKLFPSFGGRELSIALDPRNFIEKTCDKGREKSSILKASLNSVSENGNYSLFFEK